MKCKLCNKTATTQIRKPLGIRTRDSNGKPLPENQYIQLPDEITSLCQECAIEVRESNYKWSKS